MDNKLLKAACLHVGAKPDRVMTYAIYEDRIAIVVNNGVKGCPKYVVPLVELVPLALVVDATKAAWALADEKGIDLAYVVGTGKDGRVSVGDVRQAAEEEE